MKKKSLKPVIKQLQLKLLQHQQRVGYLEADEKAYTKGFGPEISRLQTEISYLKGELESRGHKPYAPMSPEAIALLTKQPKRGLKAHE